MSRDCNHVFNKNRTTERFNFTCFVATVTNTPPRVQTVQPIKSSPPTILKPLPPPVTKKPPTAIIPPQPKPSPPPLPKLPPLRPASSPVAVTKPQNVLKPLTPRTIDPSENISKTAASTDSNKLTNTSDVLSILPNTGSLGKDKVSSKEKTIVKESKTTSKDKTGFVLPNPKPAATKPGRVYLCSVIYMNNTEVNVIYILILI